MKNLIALSILSIIFFSCNKESEELDLDDYYIRFSIRNGSQKVTNISLKYDKTQNINGNGVNGEDFVWVGFGFSGTSPSIILDTALTELSFYLGVKVPEEELFLDSGSYEFLNPENYLSYLPKGNVFAHKELSFSTSYHENLNSFCSAQNDENFDNEFEITNTKYFIDENEKDAMNVEGKFITNYNSICENGSFEITEGTFRIKVLIDKIP
jgi:hypothetical protein